ncbi:MAG: cadmium-translocating P-type ATPase [Syntrophomonadaceae bacterium]|jgi:Cd2+/Zn2+-exporting ATPase|nr:cadmium-translocating P-type ATPase [Syntrophomonadaceae bacterium]
MAEAAVKTESKLSAKISVFGMDCPDCAAKVEKAVSRMPGVIGAAVAFPAGRLRVEYNPDRITINELVAKVKELGYHASDDEEEKRGLRNAEFRTAGMDGAECAACLEVQVPQSVGVGTAAVNYGSGIQGQYVQKERASYWRTNQYVGPTIISFTMLVLGFLARYGLGLPETAVNGLFLAGVLMGGYLMAKNGISVLINTREFDMNMLMTIAVIGASVIGEFAEAAVVVFLFSLGNALQGYTLDKTRSSIRELMEITPVQALVRRGTEEVILPVEEIFIGDVIIVRPGERIAMDGRVCAGYSTVNQAPITGESIPVEKKPGDTIFAGTINGHGSLEIEVIRKAEDNTISRIIHMVEEAQGQRAPSQQFIDRFARHYTPAVMLAAALVAIVPPLALGQSFVKWFYEAMALLLVACPCALVLSTPVSIVSAIGNAARNGVLFKGGVHLEEAGSLAVVAFDKTGTLTEGRPRVTDLIPRGDLTGQELLSLAAAIEKRSEHPLGVAIVEYAREQGVDVPTASAFTAVPGKGARAFVGGTHYQIGSPRFYIEQAVDLKQVEEDLGRLQGEGKTVMLLGDDERILGVIALADGLRENSRASVKNLKESGIQHIVMLTGDNENTARAIASQAGIDDFRADLLPEDKVAVIGELLAEYGKVAMVGDGINDAPAMALSTVGIAMGTAGTDTALETADIALMADDLTKLSFAIRLSRRTIGIIKQNIALALLIKGIIFLLVIPGWLTLWLAVIADTGSALLVTLNGMRLLREKSESRPAAIR